MARSLARTEFEIAERIFIARGRKVMLDSDLAEIYGVTTSRLNEQFRRNRARFPADFAFELSYQEFRALISQNATSKPTRGGRRKAPVVFTEHGAIMLATILNSKTAVEASVQVVRAFIQLRDLLSTRGEINAKLNQLESKLNTHDEALQQLFEAIRQLVDPAEPKHQREIGFHVKDRARTSSPTA